MRHAQQIPILVLGVNRQELESVIYLGLGSYVNHYTIDVVLSKYWMYCIYDKVNVSSLFYNNKVLRKLYLLHIIISITYLFLVVVTLNTNKQASKNRIWSLTSRYRKIRRITGSVIPISRSVSRSGGPLTNPYLSTKSCDKIECFSKTYPKFDKVYKICLLPLFLR